MKFKVILVTILAVWLNTAGGKSLEKVTLSSELSHGVLKADHTQTAYIRIGLTGFPCEMKKRPPANIAIVIDKSGSMSGDKIAKTRQAAIMVINKLNRNDIVSVITYDTSVEVIVPATKATDKSAIQRKINLIQAGGSTALYDGVQKGACELRKFIEDNYIHRLILLSDGLANRGPSLPSDLARVGRQLIEEGISCTTIGLGLGYNEDLMSQLAFQSDGGHYFAKSHDDLIDIFNREFDRAVTAVAQDVEIIIECNEGVRPVRILAREGKIDGQKITVKVNQIYSEMEKYLLLEVEVPATRKEKTLDIAKVNVRYNNLKTESRDTLKSELEVKFSTADNLIEKYTNKKVMIDVVEQIANEKNELAVALRDRGRTDEAQKLLRDNSAYLDNYAEMYDSKKLKDYSYINQVDSENLDESNWSRQRKSMRTVQSSSRTQNNDRK